MSTSSPEFFYFDIGNVLVDFDHEIAVRNLAALTRLSPQHIREALDDDTLAHNWDRGKISDEAFHTTCCESLGIRLDLNPLLHAVSDIFELRPHVMALVQQLHDAGGRLGLLSNTCDPHWRQLKQAIFGAQLDQFEARVLSFEQQCLKPEPEIYRIAAEMADVPPDRIFFVDDRQENVNGARTAGFDAVLFVSVDRLAMDLGTRGMQVKHG